MENRKHFYNKETRKIIFHDTLESIQLNETSDFIYCQMVGGSEKTKVIEEYMEVFGVNEATASSDFSLVTKDLEESEVFWEESNEIQRGDFNPQIPIIHIIKNCNSPCMMCDCWKEKEKLYHSREDLYKIHLKMKEKGALGIMISGGEPLMHPELKGILSDLKLLGLPIHLNTNALLLDRNSDWLTKLEIEFLVISMDGSDKESYHKIRGVNKYDKVWSSIEKFKNKNEETKIILRTTLTRQNIKTLDKFAEKAISHGVGHIGFTPLDVTSSSFARDNIEDKYTNKLIDSLMPSLEEIERVVDNLKKQNEYSSAIDEYHKSGYFTWGLEKIIECLMFYKDEILKNHATYDNSICMFPYFSLVLDYDGGIKNCFYSESFGNLSDIDNIDWNFEDRISKLEKSGRCKSCRGKVFCDDGNNDHL
jgi:MoaA/NifB/PqqE/SkfB family radical SAM enzyme